MYNPWEDYEYDGTCGECEYFEPCPHCGESGFCVKYKDWFDPSDKECDIGEYSEAALRKREDDYITDKEEYEDYLYDCWKDEHYFGGNDGY